MNLLKSLKYKFFGQDVWRIGIIEAPFETVLELDDLSEKVTWVEINSRNDYEADPFVFKIEMNYYIAYEEFDYLQGNAKLNCIDLFGNKYDFFENINNIKGHKSFPCIYNDGGNIYCLPEEGDRGGLFLYKYNSSHGRFEYIAQLLGGGKYIDSCVTNINSMYYIFTSTITEPFKQKLFVANEITGPYVEHPASPITIDKSHGRNGGCVTFAENKIFRIAQNCSETYGGSISIFTIDEINSLKYRESLVREITPITPYNLGIHTISSLDDYTVIDGKNVKYNIGNLFRKTIYKLMLILRMGG